MHVVGLQIRASSNYEPTVSGIWGPAIGGGSSSLWVDSCIIRPGTATYKGSGINAGTYKSVLRMWNSVIYGFTNGLEISSTTGTSYLYSNTLSINTTGLTLNGAGTKSVKNCLFSGNTTDVSGTISDSYCAVS